MLVTNSGKHDNKQQKPTQAAKPDIVHTNPKALPVP